MGLLDSIFKKKEKTIKTYKEFWDWFLENEKQLFKIIKSKNNVVEKVFPALDKALENINIEYYYQVGMFDDDTAEIIFTVDGKLEHFVFIEDIVAAAPTIPGWTFQALKAKDTVSIGNIIDMNDYSFHIGNISFYSIVDPETPDSVDITLVYQDFQEQDFKTIQHGCYIFLDHLLGEEASITLIDSCTIIGKESATEELIPTSKLGDYIIWREKEFLEKYDNISHNTEEDEYSSIDIQYESGESAVAIVDNYLMQWEYKASHPWMIVMEFKYNGEKQNGYPSSEEMEMLNKIEDEFVKKFKCTDGYLSLGRQTGINERTVFFACKEYRKPSRTLFDYISKYKQFEFSYQIYKDKYWMTMERFNG
jgi:hypothetical protein